MTYLLLQIYEKILLPILVYFNYNYLFNLGMTGIHTVRDAGFVLFFTYYYAIADCLWMLFVRQFSVDG